MNKHFDTVKDIASYLKTSTRVDRGDDFGEDSEISIRFNKLTSDIGSFESIFKDSLEFKSEKETILTDLSDLKKQQEECQGKIDSNSSSQSSLSADLEIKFNNNQLEGQTLFENEQNRLEALRLEQIELQTNLQMVIANEQKMQTRLLRLSQKIQNTKDRLNSLKEYVESELNRLKSDASLPDVIKYLICDKYIAYLENSNELKDAIEFLDMPHRLIFGALVNRINDIKDELNIEKKEIDRVYESLRYRVLLDNLADAKKGLYKLDRNKEKYENSEIKRAKEQKELENCQKQRLKDPDEYLGFWDSLTNGIFNKNKRSLYNEYNEKEDIYKKAKNTLSQSDKSLEKLKNRIFDDEQKLLNLGYPTTSSKVADFEEFLMGKRVEFIKEYPFFDEFSVKYELF